MNTTPKPPPPTPASPPTGGSLAPGDGVRIFLTAFMVYAVFWNPWLSSSMTWTIIDAALSYVDKGLWVLTHHALYGNSDLAVLDGRYLLKQPPGLVLPVIPVYLVWKCLGGPAETVEAFQSINSYCALLLSAPASALLAVECARLAAQLGAPRRAQLWTAFMVAFGTQNFFFGTTFFKENFVALAIVISFRWTLSAGPWPRALLWSGFMASVAVAITYPAAILLPIFFMFLWIHHGARQALQFFLGSIPVSSVLFFYNWSIFGSPLTTGYEKDPMGPQAFIIPKADVLFGILFGPEGGLFLYAPFLILAIAGLNRLWHIHQKVIATCIIGITMSYWLLYSSHISNFTNQAICAVGLGNRFLFPIVPFLAVAASTALPYISRRLVVSLSGLSLVFAYLNAQAGFMANNQSLTYAIKTFLSGFGMGVFFKEALPKWLGIETLHTFVSRPDVHASDIWPQLLAGEKWHLIVNQLIFFALNMAIFTLIGYTITRMWQRNCGTAYDTERVRLHQMRSRF